MSYSFKIDGMPKLIFGAGEISNIAELVKNYGNNVLLITGLSSLKKSGRYEEILSVLREADIKVFEESIVSEPSPGVVDKIVKEYLNKNVEVICAIGGGSVVDAGKAVSAMLTEKGFVTVKDYLEGFALKKPSGTKIPFIAVPTTSGTGSEATKNAVISEIGENGFKKSLRHDNYIPDIAVIDPALIVDCPLSVSSAAGFDTLSQLIESYISTHSTPFTDSLTEYAILRCLIFLPLVIGEPDNIDYRAEMAYCSFISGITLAHAGLGSVHGMAGIIGGYSNVPHGVACANLLIPWLHRIVEYGSSDNEIEKVYAQKLIQLSKKMNQKESDEKVLLHNFFAYVSDIYKKLEISKLSKYDLAFEQLKIIAEKSGNKNNPVNFSSDERYKIIKDAY